MLVAQSGGQAAPGDALEYERGFLVTGNYRVGGVDFTGELNPADGEGLATGQIRFDPDPSINKTIPGIDNTVPAGSEIVGAYLYWESVYQPGAKPTDGVEFRGNVIDPGAQWGTGPLFNDELVLAGPTNDTNPVPGLEWETISTLEGNNAPCWGSASSAGNARLTMFKFDVLHLLPKLLDGNNNWTGRRLVNDADLTTNYPETGTQPYGLHTVRLREGSGTHAIQSAGAALVVIYRNTSEPLTKIVMYDGAFTGATMTQTLRGFFQHTGTNVGQLTHLVGTGGNNQTELLFFNGSNKQSIVATNSFPQTSPSSDRSWAFPTYKNLSMTNTGSAAGFGGSAITTVNYQNTNPQHCSSWGGIIFSTPVLDDDHDGLPDALEASSTSGGAAWRNPDGPAPTDPNASSFPNTLLPDINAMGARTGRKDILVEVNALSTVSLGTMRYGDVSAPYDSANNIPFVDIPEHDHMPAPEALKLVGDAFLAKGIHVHFDVGPTLAGVYSNAIYGNSPPSDPADNYIALGGARGGETLLESLCNSAPGPCHFEFFPGTVGYKFGLELIRNAPVKDNGAELTSSSDADDWDDNDPLDGSATRRRRFDGLRASLVHYALYAHARGKPKSFPCVKNGIPTDYPSVGNSCSPLQQNPAFDAIDYHVPSSSSGVGDLPGGNFMVTLGLWDALNGVGTTYNQAATTFHELGHNLNLWHGGLPAILGQKQVNGPGSATFVEPQCKPNHQTTMSYMFQAHGLITVTGDAVLDYSDQELGNLNEAGTLPENKFDDIPTYRPTWFAPASSTLAMTTLGVPAATRFCNGVKFGELNPPGPPSPAMARVWASSLSTSNPPDWDVPINWNGENSANTTPNLNVNFDGVFGGTQTLGALNEVNDWARIRLDQIGAASNVVVRRLEGGPEDPNGVPTLVSGDSLGGDSLGGDSLGGDSLGGDSLGGDSLGGDSLGGDSLGGDSLGGDSLGGDSLGGDSLGGDSLGGDSLGGDSLGGGELDSPTGRSMGRGDPRTLDACVLGGIVPTQTDPGQDGCSGAWYDNTGAKHNAQPAAGDPFHHKILLTWFEPTSEPVDFYELTQTGGGVTIPYTLEAENLPTVGGRVSWVVTDPPPNQLPDHVNFTFTLVPTLDDGEIGTDYETTIAAVNDWPLAVDREYKTPRGTPLVVPVNLGLIQNNTTDSDSPAAPLALLFASVETPPPSGPGGGTLTAFDPDGSFTFTPHPNTRNQDVVFFFRVSNGNWTHGGPLNNNANPVADKIGKVTIRVLN